MTFRVLSPAFAALLFAAPALADGPGPATAPHEPPALVVAISVDQLSADLFEQYRAHYSGGLARLAQGAVFPSGYQSHAATETCPGHSTILTGAHPARTGIVANEWKVRRAGGLEDVYCAEDEANKPATGPYTPSAIHLLVPTLGERVKAAWPQAKNVAVSGKDRGALMMGGIRVDTIYFRWGSGFGTLAGREQGPEAQAVTDKVQRLIAEGAPAMAVPDWCNARNRAIPLGALEVGAGRFAIRPGEATDFLRSPRFDQATLELAGRLVESERLGADEVPDVISVSLSATDYVGHAYGTNGVESCIQVAALDAMLGEFFDMLDAKGIDYIAVLTADHGGLDLPERAREQAVPAAHRIDAAGIMAALQAETGLKDGGLAGPPTAGDIWLDPALEPADRAKALAALKALPASRRDIAAVFSAEELSAAPMPTGNPQAWSLLDRARASFFAGRSGDVVMLLAPGVSPIPEPRAGIVATHGSPWDYDRRVPILFWRKGMAQFEQPYPVETVDIAPTLAAVLGLAIPEGAFDGRCLDLDSGVGDTCR